MAGSSLPPVRKSGSPTRLSDFKKIQSVAGTGGRVNPNTATPSAPSRNIVNPNAPPGVTPPGGGRPQVTNREIGAPTAQENYEEQLRRRIRAENTVRDRTDPMDAWKNYTPKEREPQYTANTQAPVQASWLERPAVGGGMVRGRGEAPHRVDRTGVEVTSVGGTPIRIDNNLAIPGQATAAQAQEIRTTNKNSVDYNQYKDYEAIAKQSAAYASEWDRLSRAAIDPNATPEQREKAANDLKLLEDDMKYYGEQSDRSGQGLAAEKAKYEPGVNQYRGEVATAAKKKADEEEAAAAAAQRKTVSTNNANEAKAKLGQMFTTPVSGWARGGATVDTSTLTGDHNLVNRRANEINNLLPTIGDNSPQAQTLRNDITRMLSELASSDDPNLIRRRRNSINESLDQLASLGSGGTTTPPVSSSGIATSGQGLAPTGQSQQSLTSVDGQQPTTQSATTAPTSGPIDPISGLPPNRHDATRTPGRDKHGDPRYDENIGGMTANDVAEVYNIPPDQALYYLQNGATFSPDGTVMKVGGVTYDGSEIFDALSGNTIDPQNAKAGQALRTGWVNQVTEEGNRSRLAAEQAGLDDAQKRVEAELNKPLDLTALTRGFDRTIAAQKQSAARNKALALKAQMEQGAESGASVNQMMGMATETGYGYDTEAQMQATALNLQKEMEIVKATKEDASRKLGWAINLYNNAKTDADRAKYWAYKTQQDEVLRQNQIHEANIAAQANDPGIGAYLAAAGIGVAGALGSIFSGGATGVAAAGAITSLLGAGASMYGMSQGGGGPVTAPANFIYQGPPGSAPSGYRPNTAPGGLYVPGGKNVPASWSIHNGNASVKLGV